MFTSFVCIHMNIFEIIRSFSDIRQMITVRHLYIISAAFLGVLLTTQFFDVCSRFYLNQLRQCSWHFAWWFHAGLDISEQQSCDNEQPLDVAASPFNTQSLLIDLNDAHNKRCNNFSMCESASSADFDTSLSFTLINSSSVSCQTDAHKLWRLLGLLWEETVYPPLSCHWPIAMLCSQ